MTTETKAKRIYSEEFKREAVALVTEKGYSIREAAEQMEVPDNYIRRWKRKYAPNSEKGGLTQDERAELEKLRKENKRLKLEHEILKYYSLQCFMCIP